MSKKYSTSEESFEVPDSIEIQLKVIASLRGSRSK